MSRYDVIVRGGVLVRDSDLSVADIGIEDGVIVAVAPDLDGDANQEVDARGMHVFPGVIDAHVHFNEPGRADWEGWLTGSLALAAGGGTTALEMPLNANPPTTFVSAFKQKLEAASLKSRVDFGLWGGIVPGNLADLNELAEVGVVGLKAFMSRSGTPDFQAADDLTLYEAMITAARRDLLVAVHAESDVITAGLTERFLSVGRTEVVDYLRSRPVIAEVEAVSRAILLAEETGCRLHIVHVPSGRAVALVSEARARGVDVTCETCSHYLFFTDEDVERIGAVAKCAPPIRSADERKALWAAVADGTIPIVTSDHSPAPASMKGDNDFFAIWGGISGCQSTLPALLTSGFEDREVSLPVIARSLSINVADRFRLRGKGRIQIGFDADLALVDMNARTTVATVDLQYRHRHSPYVGETLRGRILQTMLRGQSVWPVAGSDDVRGRLVTPGH